MPVQLLSRLLVLPLLIASLVLAGTVVEPPEAEAATQLTRSEKIQKAYRVAARQIGDRYKYGAAGPNRFDCSGLTYFAYQRAGFRGLPRTSSAQYDFVRKIRKRNLRKGDLVFFHDDGRVYHVGIFIRRKDGRVKILHAPNSGSRVKREFAWTTRFYAGTLRRR
ncbi:C40 family peptidase [Nocardioides sp. JQ2195]|uniref:C40 family peptidase n=1 Tax=Nocardioides sp. JQ2195 TaxID=2592334 RepID=UPI00143E623B|nr:C40 family peptidase [Nocardioides sp. JQ2195]QIX25989.1 C40 family peptidase [Nocardioides sp. JQ2195]